MLILFSHLDMFERSTTYIVQWSLYIPSSCWYIACMKIESEKKINCDVFCQIDSVQDTMYEKYFDIFLNFKYQRIRLDCKHLKYICYEIFKCIIKHCNVNQVIGMKFIPEKSVFTLSLFILQTLLIINQSKYFFIMNLHMFFYVIFHVHEFFGKYVCAWKHFIFMQHNIDKKCWKWILPSMKFKVAITLWNWVSEISMIIEKSISN